MIAKALDRAEQLFLAVAALCIVAMGVIITLNVVLRTAGLRTLPDEVVLIGELMIGVLILPLASVAATRQFISVELINSRLSRRAQKWLDALTATIGLLAVLPIGFIGLMELESAIVIGSYFFGIVEFPQWPGRLVFVLGYGLLAVRLTRMLIQDLNAALTIKGVDDAT